MTPDSKWTTRITNATMIAICAVMFSLALGCLIGVYALARAVFG
jgi:ABC-type spermidine/putrescine transport system permease subunit II